MPKADWTWLFPSISALHLQIHTSMHTLTDSETDRQLSLTNKLLWAGPPTARQQSPSSFRPWQLPSAKWWPRGQQKDLLSLQIISCQFFEQALMTGRQFTFILPIKAWSLIRLLAFSAASNDCKTSSKRASSNSKVSWRDTLHTWSYPSTVKPMLDFSPFHWKKTKQAEITQVWSCSREEFFWGISGKLDARPGNRRIQKLRWTYSNIFLTFLALRSLA